MNNNLKLKLKTLTNDSGCYLMKDKNGVVIYVGKAVNINKRVNQYFNRVFDYKTTNLVKEIEDFDFIVVRSEKEALILEYNLIKKYNPKYNIIFKDDKSYPYIVIENKDHLIVKTARIRNKDKKIKAFGPYPNTRAANLTVELIYKIFPLKKKGIYNSFDVDGSIHKLLGFDKLYAKDDLKLEKEIIKFLTKDNQEVLDILTKKRDEASLNLNFETAKEVQELINAIVYIIDKQYVEVNIKNDIDFINYHLDNNELSLCILNVRKGKIINKQVYFEYLIDSNNIYNFLYQYYQKNIVPDEIIVPNNDTKANLLEIIEVNKINVALKGVKKDILNNAYKNAKEYYDQYKKIHFENLNKNEILKNEMFNLFNKNINTIEMFDISHIASKYTVGSMVSVKGYKFDKNSYRRYKLNDSFDDLKSMQEIIYRRYYKVISENLIIPDLILVDGGYNQLSVAKKIIEDLGLKCIVAGLGKDDKHNTSYLIKENYEKIDLKEKKELFIFFSKIQDEVHRYAINYHKKLLSKSLSSSILYNIKGVKIKNAIKLFERFKSIEGIKNATIEELNEILAKQIALNVYNYFRR